MVAKRDRSSGGAQNLQIPWQAGYVTPWGKFTDDTPSNNQFRRRNQFFYYIQIKILPTDLFMYISF